jgi:hypothetical protein
VKRADSCFTVIYRLLCPRTAKNSAEYRADAHDSLRP